MTLDANLAALSHAASYPLQYGYACVGQVAALGDQVDASWLGKTVFAFQPHASHFSCTPDQLIPVPDDISPEAAIFLANMETAVNLLMDAKPLLGERVLVLGQGVVGLLVTGLLAQFPLAQVCAVDAIAARRDQALALGAGQAFDLTEFPQLSQALTAAGADLVFELSGAPAALNLAIDACGFGSRIVIGSWYGNKSAAIHLGGSAHRNRLQFITSQVSSIAPEHSGRWDKARRFASAWDMIRRLQPQQLINRRAALAKAADLYRDLDQTPQDILQAVITY
jgi:threonine dehydrogenase-like Zn-dependent dehydrogenase